MIQRPAHIDWIEEGVARWRLGGEAGQGIAIASVLEHPDWIFLGVGIDIPEHHPVGIAAAGGIAVDPLQQPGGSRGAGGVVGRLTVLLVEIGAGGIGPSLRLEVVDHHIYRFAAGQLAEGLGQGRAVFRRAAG